MIALSKISQLNKESFIQHSLIARMSAVMISDKWTYVSICSLFLTSGSVSLILWNRGAPGSFLASGRGAFILKLLETDTAKVCNAADLIMYFGSLLRA